MPSLDEALVVTLPMLVKAVGANGRRLVEVEASNEAVDSEGDVVLQQALLKGAPGFLRSGVLDLHHYSEIGQRIGIANPTEWIVGVPREVKDLGGGRTSVVGELHEPIPGRITKADELWDSLSRNPPVRWYASIFGWPNGPDGFVDARKGRCPEAPAARRFVLKDLDWRSLAFTRNPINTSIEDAAHVVTMKAYVDALVKSNPLLPTEGASAGIDQTIPALHRPRNRVELLGHYTHHIEKGACPHAGAKADLGRSVASFRNHFAGCCKCDDGDADIMGLALMQALRHAVA